MSGGKVVAILMALSGAGSAVAQSPISISSQIETGWTSNATDSATGGADIYVTHRHDLSLGGGSDVLQLRGSLSISQTRFAATQFEDDAEAGGALEAQWMLSDNAVLRLGFGMKQRWTGDGLSVMGVVVPVYSTGATHEYLAEFALRGTDQQVIVAVTADWTLPGNSMLAALGVPPLRLSPEVGSVVGRVDWERALAPNLAVLTGMKTWFTIIPELDQLTYLRAPADGGQVSGGLRLAEGAWSVEGRGGVDLVWPKGFGTLTRILPYLSGTASVTPKSGLTLVLRGKTGVELADPVDGVAGRTADLTLETAWALAPEITLSASASARQEWGLFAENLGRSEHAATLGVSYAAFERISYRALLSWARHDNPAESYDKAGFALSMSGDF